MNKLFPGLEKQAAIKDRDLSNTVPRQVHIPPEVFDWAVLCQRTFPRGEKPSKHDVYVWLAQQATSRQDVVIGDADFLFSPMGVQTTVYLPRDVHAAASEVLAKCETAPTGGMEAVYIAFMRCAARAIESEQYNQACS
ncbi:MAG TPA: hypothetical protein PKD78_01205 [Saprospiraceae bacterium]|nr:hypothetical protein [Saprospiraceae bacterium]